MPALEGRTAMVAGGGTGIGRAIALAFAREGARVAVFGRRVEPLREVVDAITAVGGTARAVAGDAGDEGDVGRLVDDQGPDGVLARTTYLRAGTIVDDAGNPQRTAMLRRRAELEQALEELRARKESLAPDAYDDALEKILLEIARLDRALRSRS